MVKDCLCLVEEGEGKKDNMWNVCATSGFWFFFLKSRVKCIGSSASRFYTVLSLRVACYFSLFVT